MEGNAWCFINSTIAVASAVPSPIVYKPTYIDESIISADTNVQTPVNSPNAALNSSTHSAYGDTAAVSCPAHECLQVRNSLVNEVKLFGLVPQK